MSIFCSVFEESSILQKKRPTGNCAENSFSALLDSRYWLWQISQKSILIVGGWVAFLLHCLVLSCL